MGSGVAGFLEWWVIELPDQLPPAAIYTQGRDRQKQLCRWSPVALTLSWGDSTSSLSPSSCLPLLLRVLWVWGPPKEGYERTRSYSV